MAPVKLIASQSLKSRSHQLDRIASTREDADVPPRTLQEGESLSELEMSSIVAEVEESLV